MSQQDEGLETVATREDRAQLAAPHLARAMRMMFGDGVLCTESTENTPLRMARALMEMTEGYDVDFESIATSFDAEGYDQIIVVKDVPFTSLCEHHILPFTGTVSVAYLPGDKIIGLSKIPRVIKAVAGRLQVQERMTQDIASTVKRLTRAIGVAVVVRGRHSCMSLRGVRSAGEMVTSVMLDVFRLNEQARTEVLQLLK